MAIMGGARCYSKVVVMHVLDLSITGMVVNFEAANPRYSLATHLPRWRPYRAGCVRAALAHSSDGARLLVLDFVEVIECVFAASWSC